MDNQTAKNFNAKTITPAEGKNPRILYEHQIEAMRAMDKINKKEGFRSLLVLPTGGGKTLTAVYWLLKNALDKDKKVLWIAHRHLLLEQAAEAFELNAYSNVMVNKSPFKYRVISGMHDRPVHIKKDDNIVIAGKDSIIRSLNCLDDWLEGEDVYLVIDEAHHAVAKSYKIIINYVFEHAANAKMLGLTATPFRTSEKEKGALKALFPDDIVYKTDLETLIKKEILATPVCTDYKTEVLLGDKLGVKALKSIENLDVIPESIAKDIAENSKRNHFIVDKYFENYEMYGPTIVFALNQSHAIALNALFNEKGKKYGIKSDYIISSVKDAFTGVMISNEENNEKIEAYKSGDLQVLINVNILTEGTDLPKTHSVFLTRPTVSSVLMTQMVGRALRGLRAGGTKEAYIVSFVDDWNSRIAWVNPEMLTNEPFDDEPTTKTEREYNIRLIAISKLEEFALLADASVDTSDLESIPAIERIPLGMYTFTFTDFDGEQSLEHNHQILVYNSTKIAYEKLIAALSDIMNEYEIAEETIPEDKLSEMLKECKNGYFDDDMIPAYNPKDIEHLLKFYAQKEAEPLFITFDELDRKRLDVSTIAAEIIRQDLRRSEINALLEELWLEYGSIFPIYYSNFYFFKKMVQMEIDLRENEEEYMVGVPKGMVEKRNREELTLHELRKEFPEYYQELIDYVTSKSMDDEENYVCADCGMKIKQWGRMQIDHIKPMAKGGLSIPENLQLLCRPCNLRKSDK